MSYFILTNIAGKNNYLGFFKFYQPKATGGGFLIFEWTLPDFGRFGISLSSIYRLNWDSLLHYFASLLHIKIFRFLNVLRENKMIR
jgi:hypothetical protein